MSHDKAVFDRAGLAFVGIANDIFHGIGLLSHQIPLHARGKTGATHAAKFGSFKLCQDFVTVARLNQLAHHSIFFAVAVRVCFARNASVLRVGLANFFAAKGPAPDLLGVRSGDIRENLIVDPDRGGAVAAAKAGNITNLHFFRPGTRKAALQFSPQPASSIEMAAHVRANANFRLSRKREMKMRVEAGDAVNLIEGGLCALGKPFRLGQKAVAKLDSPKVVEDHVVPSRAQSRA